jgi:hypothetical protein
MTISLAKLAVDFRKIAPKYAQQLGFIAKNRRFRLAMLKGLPLRASPFNM